MARSVITVFGRMLFRQKIYNIYHFNIPPTYSCRYCCPMKIILAITLQTFARQSFEMACICNLINKNYTSVSRTLENIVSVLARKWHGVWCEVTKIINIILI